MSPEFLEKISTSHFKPKILPGEEEIDHFIVRLLQFLFPELSQTRGKSEEEILAKYKKIKAGFEELIAKTKACNSSDRDSICGQFFRELEKIYDLCIEDAEAILQGDPAAQDLAEVIRTYPGFFAISIYRIAHVLYKLEVPTFHGYSLNMHMEKQE